MKNHHVLKRIFFFLSGLFLILFSAVHLLGLIKININIDKYIAIAKTYINSQIGFVAVLIIGIILLLLFIKTLNKKLLFSKTDLGDFSISTDALEDMVEQSIENYTDIKCQNIKVVSKKNNLFIRTTVELATGSDIPHTVTMLQKTILDYIQKCTGLEVSSIQLKVKPIKDSNAKVYHSNENQIDVIDEKTNETSITSKDSKEPTIENKASETEFENDINK